MLCQRDKARLLFNSNSNSIWTLIALNLPFTKRTQTEPKTSQSVSVSRDGVRVGFKLLSERGQGGRHNNLIRKSIENSGGIKSKTTTKLFHRFMNRRNGEGITTTLTVPGTIRTAVGRKIWIKMDHISRFMIDSARQRGLPTISNGKNAFNLSLCLFKPKMINLVLSGFNYSLLVDIHSLTSSRYLFNCSKAADVFLWD